MKNKETFNSYLAWIDILGFKAMCEQRSLGRFFRSLHAELRRARETPLSGIGSKLTKWSFCRDIHYHLFQDTIVAYPSPDKQVQGHAQLKALLIGCSLLYFALIERKVPFKGAISWGRVRIYPNKKEADAIEWSLINGEAVFDAYEYEERQDWVGLMLSPRIVEKDGGEIRRWLTTPYRDLVCSHILGREESPVLPYLVAKAPVPFHGGERFDGYAVLPTRRTDDSRADAVKSVKQTIGNLEIMKTCCASISDQEKYVPAIQWLADVVQHLPPDGK